MYFLYVVSPLKETHRSRGHRGLPGVPPTAEAALKLDVPLRVPGELNAVRQSFVGIIKLNTCLKTTTIIECDSCILIQCINLCIGAYIYTRNVIESTYV